MKHEPVQNLFALVAQSTPDQVAISCGDTLITYHELQRRTDKLAHLLLSGGAKKESIVAILLENKVDAITSIIAVLKAGAVFVPFDPLLPDLRLETMVREVTPDLFITEAKLLQRLNGLSHSKVLNLDKYRRLDQLALEGVLAAKAAEPSAPDDFCYIYFTSGSTGRPKSIAGRLKGIDHFIRWQIETLGIGKQDRVSQLLPLVFDGSLRDIFVPLCAGGTICVPEHNEIVSDVKELVSWIDRESITLIHCVPTLFRAILNEELRPNHFRALRYVLLAGEALLPSDVGKWRQVFGDRVKLINLYGTSETTMAKFTYEVQPGDEKRRSVPVGKPMRGARALIVDEDGRACPPGAIGEIYIRTPYRSHGYYKQPELTAEVFIPNPFNSDPNDIVYKTGDLGRMLDDGNIEVLGRRDQQVKIRGVRVELEEINNFVRGYDGVKDVAVIDRKDTSGGNFLCAYVVAGGELKIDSLREYLHERLPGSMVPSAFVIMEKLPRTISGKIDRRALPDLKDRTGRGEYVAPRSGTEQIVADIWAKTLGLPKVSLHDNFFELGGHSLLATQVMVRVRKALGIELPLRALFENPTVAKFVTHIDSSAPGSTTTLLQPIVPVPRDRDLPLSFSQQRLWFLEQLKPGDPLYHSFHALLISGPLDIKALELSINEIIRRHEILHTIFETVGGKPVQRVQPFMPMSLQSIDLSDKSHDDRRATLEQLAGEESQRPFDISRGPLIRALLVVLDAKEHALLFTLHHIVDDGWSIGILSREMSALYEAFATNAPVPLPDLPIQYADFAMWQREYLQGEVRDEQLRYWKQQLANVPPVLELPADRPREEFGNFSGARVTFELNKELTQQLKKLNQREGVTLFMVLLAAFAALLSRYTGQPDIVIGTAIANRNRDETEPLIGFFINMLAMRTDLSGNPTFIELLKRVKQMTLGAYQHQDVPFEQIIEMLQPQRSFNTTPLYQVEFTLQNLPVKPLEAHGLRFAPLDVQAVSSDTDLDLMMSESENGLFGEVLYRTDLFDATTIERMMDHFENLLKEIVRAPEQRILELPLTSGSETRALLGRWGVTDMNANKLVHQLFEEQAARTPEALAVATNDRTFTYAELNQRANQLARYLKRHDARPEMLVAVHLEPSFDLLVALLAILKAGAAFLPLDPSYPPETLATTLADANASIIVTREAVPADLPISGAKVISLDASAAEIGYENVYDPSVTATGDNLAYAIYTSGSTGQSNGVLINHDSLTKYCLDFIERIGLRARDRIFQFASPSFDVALEEIFPTLLCGATVVFTTNENAATDLLRELDQLRVTGIELPTAYWHEWVRILTARSTRLPETLRFVIIGGEKVSSKRLAAWQDFGVPLIHVYGLTEATITSTVYDLPRTDQKVTDLPLGKSLPHTQIYLLDPYLRPVPPGITGEMYVGGECLARSYLNRPVLTAERFIPNPFSSTPGARMYKTGDLARSSANGDLLFQGRVDHQLKIRGYRIEPDGVEVLLKQHPLVQDAVVTLATSNGNGHNRLFKRAADGAVIFADQNVVAEKLATLNTDEVEKLFARLEALSEDESETILAMELQLDQERERTTIRRLPQFEVQLKLKDEKFINPPKEAQRNWLLRRALDEFTSDLKHLDVQSRRFVAGSARPRLETVPWGAHHAEYDEHNLFIAGQQVMQDWELPLMDAMAKVVTESHGDILEAGFGMALSATCIQKYGVRSYTIMEANDEVVKRFHEWKKQFPGRDIRLLHGRWHDTHHQLADESMDGVFFDTVPTFEDEYLREVIDNVVMAEDFFPVAARVLRPGGIFTWYTNEIDTLSRRHQRLIQQYFRSFEVTVCRPLYPPEDCHYWFADSMVVVKAVK